MKVGIGQRRADQISALKLTRHVWVQLIISIEASNLFYKRVWTNERQKQTQNLFVRFRSWFSPAHRQTSYVHPIHTVFFSRRTNLCLASLSASCHSLVRNERTTKRVKSHSFGLGVLVRGLAKWGATQYRRSSLVSIVYDWIKNYCASKFTRNERTTKSKEDHITESLNAD